MLFIYMLLERLYYIVNNKLVELLCLLLVDSLHKMLIFRSMLCALLRYNLIANFSPNSLRL